jgi:transposase-like protein
MAKAIFQDRILQNEDAAREALEAVRWPDGPICPHCGNSDAGRIAKVEGVKKSHRPGLHYCNECKGQFTVTVGTVFERSKVPLTKWWMAAHLFNQGKNGASAHEMHRQLGVTYKTAWFMMHRLREAMADLNPAPMGGAGGQVQADETYYGNTSRKARARKLRKNATSGASRRTTSKTFSFNSSADARDLRPLRRAAPTTLLERVCVSLHPPRQEWHQRWRTDGAHDEGHRRQAPDVPAS